MAALSDELAGLGLPVRRAERSTEDMQARVSAVYQLVELGGLTAPGRASPVMPQLGAPGDEAARAVEERMADLKRELGAA